MKNLSIKIINQLKDNYSFLISKKNQSSAFIIDPADSFSHIKHLKENNLTLEKIIITHHHDDHTGGILGLIDEYPNVKIYASSKLPSIQSTIIKEGDELITTINQFKIIQTPGHTMDHIILYDSNNKILFAGDTLFRLGCGRVFEGTFNQMQNSLQKINLLPNDVTVYCGHEYTLTNLKFLEIFFNDMDQFKNIRHEIELELLNTKRSIPFNLGKEKDLNPFLNQNSLLANRLKTDYNFSDNELFRFLREKKDKF